MQLAPFLLDEWIRRKYSADPPIEFDLASSTGPVWTYRELLALEPGLEESLLDTPLFYTSPRGAPELREAIAEMQAVDPEHVQIVTGSSEALLALFYFAAEPGANVVLPYPEFPAYTAVVESLGIEIRRYHLRAESGFQVDPDEVRRAVDRNTRIVLVNSPHNPSGAVLDPAVMESLHDWCVERGVMFVSDEVYHPIYHEAPALSAARLPHATVLGDFSKALCLSGLRTGWVIERDAERRNRIQRAHNYFSVSTTSLSDRLAAAAIRRRDAILGRAQRITAVNLAILDGFFARHIGRLRWIRPAGGMTAFPWMADNSDAREFCLHMMQSGVLMVPGECFGMRPHFRLGFGASGENFVHAVERMDAAMSRSAAAG